MMYQITEPENADFLLRNNGKEIQVLTAYQDKYGPVFHAERGQDRIIVSCVALLLGKGPKLYELAYMLGKGSHYISTGE